MAIYTRYGNEVEIVDGKDIDNGWITVRRIFDSTIHTWAIYELKADNGLIEIMETIKALETPKFDRNQYETACLYVRYLHHNLGIVAIPAHYMDYYGGFRRTANREGANYPEIAESYWQLALDAWQNIPYEKYMRAMASAAAQSIRDEQVQS